MIINALGIWEHSPKEISDVLRSLNVSHSVFHEHELTSKSEHRYNIVDIDLGYEQPAWPVVLNGMRSYGGGVHRLHAHYPRLLLVCDSKSALESSNLVGLDSCRGKFPSTKLKDFLSKSTRDLHSKLQDPTFKEFRIETKEVGANDLVRSIAKPSILADIQTLIYKITPYADQKKTRIAVTLYLDGSLSLSRTTRVLKRNLKATPVLELLKSAEAQSLVEAIRLYKEGQSLEKVVHKFNMEGFDITYVTTSAAKMSAADLK